MIYLNTELACSACGKVVEVKLKAVLNTANNIMVKLEDWDFRCTNCTASIYLPKEAPHTIYYNSYSGNAMTEDWLNQQLNYIMNNLNNLSVYKVQIETTMNELHEKMEEMKKRLNSIHLARML
jgi:hypothetical protein